MDISVIIPVYNVERYIRSCLLSVLKQKESAFEIICVDDASNDASAQIIAEMANTDNRIKLVKNMANRGQAYARNEGLNIAKGEYVYFLDADDELADEWALNKLNVIAKRENVSCVCFDSIVEYEDDSLRPILNNQKYLREAFSPGVYSGHDYFNLFFENPCFSVAVWRQFWKRSFLIGEKLLYVEETSPHEDLLFTFQAFFLVDKIFYFNEALHKYRFRANSSSSGEINTRRFNSYELIYIDSLRFMEANLVRSKGISQLSLNQYLKACLTPIYTNYAKLIEKGLYATRAKDGEIGSVNDFYKEWILNQRFPLLERVFTSDEVTLIKNSNSIFVYGAGNYSIQLQQMLLDFGITNYVVCVTKRKGKEIEISEVEELSDGAVVILAASSMYRDEMRKNANRLGFSEIIALS